MNTTPVQVAISSGTATANLRPVGTPHPFDMYVDLDLKPKSPEWVLDKIIQVGVVTIAGMRGVGKTTSMLPIAAAVAHLCPPDYALRPTLRRHVIWITEDCGQAERVLAALVRHAGWSSREEVREWFHVVEAQRLPAAKIAEVASIYGDRYTTVHQGRRGTVQVRPLVVLDTSNACIHLENESDNSEVGQAMGKLKSAFAGFPVLIIHHLAKSLNLRDDAESLTVRGAGAWEADAHQCLYLVKTRGPAGAEQRCLILGKRRFETDIECLVFDSHVHQVPVETIDGEEMLPLRYSVARHMGVQQRAQQRDIQAKEAHEERRQAALRLVDEARQRDHPINKSQLRSLLKGNAKGAGELIQELLHESWLVTVDVPARLRTNAAKGTFLIALTSSQRQDYLATGALPPEKTSIPDVYVKRISSRG